MNTTISTYAYWVETVGRGALRRVAVPAAPGPGRSLLAAEFGAVSPGTERLVGQGMVPPSARQAMACRSMQGSFGLPVLYGYCLVGTGIAGAIAGRRVFVMHPHQAIAEVADAHCVQLGSHVPAARATLIPNLETALNAVWDAELDGSERVVVFGAGVVGQLLCYVLSRVGTPATLVDIDHRRLESARSWPVSALRQVPPGHFDVAFHATGTGAGLQASLDAVGFEGRVLDLSWYGTRPVTLDLGSTFHWQRKSIVATQVAHVAASKRDCTTCSDRMTEVLRLLDCCELDGLLPEPIAFADLPEFMASLYRGEGTVPVPLIRYDPLPALSDA